MPDINDPENFFSKKAPILEKNRIFNNRHLGERCFILATGPSIDKQNLRYLKGETCLAVSTFCLHPHFELIKPRYYCFAPYHPPTTEEDWHSLMRKLEKATGDAIMFFGLSDFDRNQKDGLFSGRQLFFLEFSGSWEEASFHGIDLTLPVPEIMSGSIMQLMIAIYMGFERIYLLGCDLSWLLRYFGHKEHFHNNKPPQMQGAGFHENYYQSVEYEFFCNFKLVQQFRALREIASKQSTAIYNATPGGLLDVFPRVELETIFSGKKELINHKPEFPSQFAYMKTKKIKKILANEDVSNIKQLAMENRYGNWEVRFRDLKIYCNDLLSFYMAAKDIFLHGIYDFENQNDSPVVIDGGGHIGLFTLFIKKKYPKARIMVFEPDKESLCLLKMNLHANLINDVNIVEAGLYQEDGEVPFTTDGSDGSSIYGNKKNTHVPVVRLSQYLPIEVDFLKLNIEGAELEVLSEIEPHLDQINQMVIEYHGFPETGQNLHKLLTILDRAGFRYMIHDFDSETNSVTKPPFQLTQTTRFFLLIYAKKLFPVKDAETDERPSEANHISIEPVSRQFGFDRGMPIDRHYIEEFIKKNKSYIRGNVLEIGDDTYTRKYGTGVTRCDILSVVPAQKATLVGDLSTGKNIPENTFDCIIMTQTIQMIFDARSALENAIKALKKNGILLITASGISQISRYDMDRWGEYWRFTEKSLKLLLAEFLPEDEIFVEAYGNVAAAKYFLEGRAAHELPKHVLDYQDRDYQVVLAARAIKNFALGAKRITHSAKSKTRRSLETPLVLLYHRVAHDQFNAQLLAVTPENFQAHLEELSEHYRVIPLFELLKELHQEILESDTVALTFDDGYLDNLSNAMPLLEAKGLHATVFVTSGMVGTNFEFWWDSLEQIFLQNRPLPDSLQINCSKGTFEWNIASRHDHLKAHDELCEILRLESAIEANRFVDRLYEWAGVPRIVSEGHRILNDEQIKKLCSSPSIEIGSHTVTHTRLSSLSPQLQRAEITRSKAQLETLTGKSIRFLSYPFGSRADFTKETQRLVADAGYEAGISNAQGNVIAPVDMYAVPRRLVRDWPCEAFSKWLRSEDKDSLEYETTSIRHRRLSGYHGNE